MSEPTGLLDTSVVLQVGQQSPARLTQRAAISSLTLAELAAGPIATHDPTLRAIRLARLQIAHDRFDVLPFDEACAHTWPRVYTATVTAGRTPRGKRAVDLMIATTALANGLPLYTANPDDFMHLSEIMSVIPVSRISAERP